MEFESVEDLKKYLCGTGRLKFSVKVLLILNFTEKHKDCVGMTGAVWCEDGVHFLANTKIMALLLDLKANSINTNLRDHGFKIVDNDPVADLEGLQPLPDLNNWRKRKNAFAEFSRDSTIKDADEIPSIEAKFEQLEKSTTQPWYVAFVPEITRTMCSGHYLSEMIALIKILDDIQMPDAWKEELLKVSTGLWFTKVSQYPMVDLNQLIERLFPLVEGGDHHQVRQLRANFKYLIHTHSGSSQMNEHVAFSDFVRLFLRFGGLNGISGPLLEITDLTVRRDPSWDGLGDDVESSDDEDVAPQFRSGFYPTLDKLSALRELHGGSVQDWVVMQSRMANQFTLLVRANYDRVCNVALHITYYAIPLEGGYRLSIMHKDKKEIYAKTWNEMLFDILKLNREKALKLRCDNMEVRYISADGFQNASSGAVRPPEAPLQDEDLAQQCSDDQIFDLFGGHFFDE